MHRLKQTIERIAANVVGTNFNSLPALADLHAQFQELCAVAGECEDPQATPVSTIATEAVKKLENFILQDRLDASAAMNEVNTTLGNIQAMIDRAVGPAAEPIECTKPTEPAAAAHPAISADDASLVADFISESRGHIEAAEAGILQVEEHPDDLEAINAIFRAFHTIKGVAGFLNLSHIGSLAHAGENLLDLGRQGQLKLTGGAVDVILESIDLMKALITGLDEAMKSGSPISSDARLPQVLARLQACSKGEAIESSRTATESPKTETSVAKVESSPATSGAASATAQDSSVKVSTGRLDSLIDMVGELVIAESMVRQGLTSMTIEDQRLARNVAHLGKITRNLQDLTMSMRMVPIQGTFQKMSRLVRDLARKSGKLIELSMTGSETELDRNVVEAIADPLMHMIRNAVDHGIESPNDREQSGKSQSGRIELKAYHQAGKIVIEINDDGKGLRKDKILKKAIAAGLVKEGHELSEPEIFNLIFHAGLSTAEKLTDVSGRGVGMDVVKRNVEALRGQIVIRSVEGKGSTFTIRLPLTLAVIDGLAVRVGSERYIVPITSVEQSMRPTPQQLSTVQGRGEMCLIRGKLLPLIRLYRLFGVQPKTESVTEGLVVIVQDNHRRSCLFVDELLGQQQVVIKSLGEGVGKIPGISGGAILGDGNVSLILDVPGLIDSSTEPTKPEGAIL